MVNRFILNEVSYFGPGARKELPGVVARLGFNKALVVTDKGLRKFGVAKMVLDVLDEAGIPYAVFDEVKPNPTVTNVKQGIAAFKESGADFIVAIGGGSAMDTAKGVGIVCNNPECPPRLVLLPKPPSTMSSSTRRSRRRWYASTPTTFLVSPSSMPNSCTPSPRASQLPQAWMP